MTTEVIDKLFLELSQVTTAKTKREIDLESEKAQLRQRLLSAAGDDLCRLSQEEIKQYTSGEVQIPPKGEFIASCERFHQQIAEGPGVLGNCLTLAQLIAENEQLRGRAEAALADAKAKGEELAELQALINCPHNDDWFEGTRIEAAHQRERWGSEHDDSKSPEDWFWLVGYLAGKCLRASIEGDTEKAKHHTISTAAAMLNWYRQICIRNPIHPEQPNGK